MSNQLASGSSASKYPITHPGQQHHHDWCPRENLEIRPLSDHEWRVGDRRRDEKSADKVLGFIQKCDTGFEVLKLTAPDSKVTFDRLDAAVESFTGVAD